MVNQIEYIKDSDLLFQGTKKINDFAIDPANRAEANSENAIIKSDEAKAIAEAAESKSDSTQIQLDTIVIEGDSSVEAAQARENGEGVVYSNLRNRINVEIGKPSSFRAEDVALIDKMSNEFKDQIENVTWHGAKGDGETDDTSAIQSAIDAAFAKGGGTVLLPLSDYRITSSLRMKDNVILKGQGSLMWQTEGIRTTIVLDSTEINAVAIDFRGNLIESGDYPTEIIYDLTKIKHTFGAGIRNMHITNKQANRNACGIMFNCCPTSFLENVSVDGRFEVALVSAMSWFTSLRKIYAKGIFIGAFMQGMNASNVDMLLVGGRNTTEDSTTMVLNVAGKDKIDKSVGLFFRNSPGIAFNSLIAEFTYNGIMFYQAGSVIINAIYLENITNRAVEVKEKSQISIEGGHIAAVKKFIRITDRASVTMSSIDITNVETFIETIDNYSNLLIINDMFPKYSHERLQYIGHFVNNVIVVDPVNGDDGNSGYMYNADVVYPVKTLGKAINLAEQSDKRDFTISLQSDNNYDISTISRSLTKVYKFIKKGSGSNPVILKISDTSVKLSNANITIEKGVDVKDSSTNSSSTNLGIFNILSGSNTLNFLDNNISLNATANGVLQGAYNANALLMLNLSRCTIKSDWLIARPASGLGKLTVIETSVSNAITGNLVSNGIPTGVKMISSDTFNK